MASNYPASLDTTATLPAAGSVGANLSTFPHSTLHGNADDAIIAIETELGTAPSGAETTVKARLDRITPTLGALTAWTPTLTQSGVVTKTVSVGSYSRVGRRIHANCLLTVTGTGTASNLVVVSLPVSALATDGHVVGSGYLIDASVPTFVGGMVLTSSGGVNCYLVGAQSGAASEVNMRVGNGANSGFTAALAAGDLISFQLDYEAAAD